VLGPKKTRDLAQKDHDDLCWGAISRQIKLPDGSPWIGGDELPLTQDVVRHIGVGAFRVYAGLLSIRSPGGAFTHATRGGIAQATSCCKPEKGGYPDPPVPVHAVERALHRLRETGLVQDVGWTLLECKCHNPACEWNLPIFGTPGMHIHEVYLRQVLGQISPTDGLGGRSMYRLRIPSGVKERIMAAMPHGGTRQGAGRKLGRPNRPAEERAEERYAKAAVFDDIEYMESSNQASESDLTTPGETAGQQEGFRLGSDAGNFSSRWTDQSFSISPPSKSFALAFGGGEKGRSAAWTPEGRPPPAASSPLQGAAAPCTPASSKSPIPPPPTPPLSDKPGAIGAGSPPSDSPTKALAGHVDGLSFATQRTDAPPGQIGDSGASAAAGQNTKQAPAAPSCWSAAAVTRPPAVLPTSNSTAPGCAPGAGSQSTDPADAGSANTAADRMSAIRKRVADWNENAAGAAGKQRENPLLGCLRPGVGGRRGAHTLLAVLPGGGMPPFPGTTVVPPAHIPPPPKLDPAAGPSVLVATLMRAYRQAIRHHHGKECHTLQRGDLRGRPQYAPLLAGARALVEHDIPPLTWAVWSLAIWHGYLGLERWPKPEWVFSEKRIGRMHGWYREDHPAGGRLAGPVAAHVELAGRWQEMRNLVGCGLSVEAARNAVLPGDLYERLVEKARRQTEALQIRLRGEVAAGAYVW